MGRVNIKYIDKCKNLVSLDKLPSKITKEYFKNYFEIKTKIGYLTIRYIPKSYLYDYILNIWKHDKKVKSNYYEITIDSNLEFIGKVSYIIKTLKDLNFFLNNEFRLGSFI